MRKIYITILLALLPTTASAAGYLDELEGNLMRATRTTNQGAVPGEIYKAIAVYINAWIFPFLIKAAIAVTILFILYGSFQYFTAYGDENKATTAKKTISFAFIGLIVAFMAMGIAGLVQRSVTNNQALQLDAAKAPVTK